MRGNARVRVLHRVQVRQHRVIHIGGQRPFRVVLQRLSIRHQRRHHDVDVRLSLAKRIHHALEQRPDGTSGTHFLDDRLHAPNGERLIHGEFGSLVEPGIHEPKHNHAGDRGVPLRVPFRPGRDFLKERQVPQLAVRFEHSASGTHGRRVRIASL